VRDSDEYEESNKADSEFFQIEKKLAGSIHSKQTLGRPAERVLKLHGSPKKSHQTSEIEHTLSVKIDSAIQILNKKDRPPVP
jgi:hypothetical protein